MNTGWKTSLHRFLRSTTVKAVKNLHARAERPNIFIKIPGTPESLPAVEESIFSGIPVNVTLLFSPEQYLAAAEAFLCGVERRIAAGLNPNVASVASLFISRWDVAANNQVPARLTNMLGLAVADELTRRISGCSVAADGNARTTLASVPSDCCGPARGRKTRTRLDFFT